MAISHNYGLLTTAAAAARGDEASSKSTCLRERGNTLYREATAAATSIPTSRRSQLLQDAIQLYCQALSLSDNRSERAMCSKNLGQAFWARAKLTLLVVEGREPKQARLQVPSLDKAWDSLSFDLLSSVGYFLEALEASRPPSQPREWVQGVHWTLVDIAWTVDDIRDPSPTLVSRKGKILEELCSLLRRKIPPNVRLQACAVLHKACAQQSLGSAAAKRGSAAERVTALEGCLDHLVAAEFHTDTTAAAPFLLEIQALRTSVSKQLEELRRQPPPPPPPQQQQQQPQSHHHQDTRRPMGRSASHRFYHDQNAGARPMDRRSGSCRMSSSSAAGGVGVAGGGLVRGRSSEFSREIEAMFDTLSPAEFLRRVYERFPPPAAVRGTASPPTMSDELRSAYKRAISHYHPDHNTGLSQAMLSDEITKYLIINFNGLKVGGDTA